MFTVFIGNAIDHMIHPSHTLKKVMNLFFDLDFECTVSLKPPPLISE